MTITPLLKDTRVTIGVKENELPRGSRWQRTMTILDKGVYKQLNGHKITVRGVSCGLGNCYCDARITAINGMKVGA